MRSSWPEAETSTPVRCGRVSSREAARATRPIVSTNAPAGTCMVVAPAASGSFGKSSARQGAEVELRGARDDLDVLLRGPVLERQLVLRQRADDVEQQAPRQHDRALPLGRSFHLHTDADLHIGGLELHRAGVGAYEDAGQRLDRAAGGHAANRDAELIQKVLTTNGELHSKRPWSSRCCGQVDSRSRNSAGAGSSGSEEPVTSLWIVSVAAVVTGCPERGGA